MSAFLDNTQINYVFFSLSFSFAPFLSLSLSLSPSLILFLSLLPALSRKEREGREKNVSSVNFSFFVGLFEKERGGMGGKGGMWERWRDGAVNKKVLQGGGV